MAEQEHHKSKKRTFQVVLVPDEDASGSRSVRFSPWHIVALAAASFVIPMILLLGALYTTPLGGWLNIPNPEIENRYAREIIALKDRTAEMIGQLVELRSYNSMLRNALGERDVPPVGTVVRKERSNESGAELAELPSTDALTERSPVEEQYENGQTPTTFPALFPSIGYVSQGFEPQKGHFGLDIVARVGSVVKATADGHVVFSGWTQEDGNTIILSHAGGFLSFYKHNHTLMKSAGTFVRRGEAVATVGSTGETSLGPHVHFEIWKDGSPKDPSVYLLNPVS